MPEVWALFLKYRQKALAVFYWFRRGLVFRYRIVAVVGCVKASVSGGLTVVLAESLVDMFAGTFTVFVWVGSGPAAPEGTLCGSPVIGLLPLFGTNKLVEVMYDQHYFGGIPACHFNRGVRICRGLTAKLFVLMCWVLVRIGANIRRLFSGDAIGVTGFLWRLR